MTAFQIIYIMVLNSWIKRLIFVLIRYRFLITNILILEIVKCLENQLVNKIMTNLNYIKNSYMDWFGALNKYIFNTREVLTDCEFGEGKTRDHYNFICVRQFYTTKEHKKSHNYEYMLKFYYWHSLSNMLICPYD